MGKSKIEWTEVTWNPVLGCSKVSQGCKNCYAMTMSARIANSARDREDPTEIQQGYMDVVKQDSEGKYLPKWNNKIALLEGRLEEPLRWQKPRRVFVNSMSDLFHPDVPFEFVAAVFGVMTYCKDHVFQILTKRPDRMAEFFEWIREGDMCNEDGEKLDFDEPRKCIQFAISKIDHKDTILMGMTNVNGREWPASNIWLGTSVENQKSAEERIPHLLKCPAAVRFLSCEPLLGPVDLKKYLQPTGLSYPWHKTEADKQGPWIDWVIVGGESGPNARPMHPEWARSLRDQCVDADVSFFFKQWGAWIPRCQMENAGFSISDLDNNHEEILYNTGEVLKEDGSNWTDKKNSKIVAKVGKKKAGRQLDGREWNQMPISEVDHV